MTLFHLIANLAGSIGVIITFIAVCYLWRKSDLIELEHRTRHIREPL